MQIQSEEFLKNKFVENEMASIFEYGLPESVEKGFKSSKTQNLFPWQQEVLAINGVLEGNYSKTEISNL